MNASYEKMAQRLVAYETANVLWLPPTWRSSVPMQMLLMLLKTGLKQKLAWTLSKIQGINREKIEADLGRAILSGMVVPRQRFEDLVCMWM
ncbi:uncharacterized protein MONOS_17193 [Monocercomonoides exilis]|uniref:uncharacterized protein n=1 Tax=Monocercomonoides exilis TaxID=2049356 RepID=UPI00355A4132|nr:hypothetical protein MONOS_17193 [Monocercomonoides exilis]